MQSARTEEPNRCWSEVEKCFQVLRQLPHHAMILFDQEGNCGWAGGELWASEQDEIAQAIGQTLESKIGQNLLARFGIRDIQSLQDVWQGKTKQYEHRHENRSYLVNLLPLRNDEGEISGGLLLKRDVTLNRQQIEREYQSEKIRTLGMVAANTGHELLTPLAFIRTQCELLRLMIAQKNCSFERIEREMNRIEMHTQKAASIIYEMKLMLPQRQEGNFKEFPLNMLIHEALEMLEAQLEAEGVEVKRPDPLPDITVHCSPILILQVCLHLMNNALYAMSERAYKRIRIHMGSDGRKSWFSINDNGVGIPEYALRHVFDPFFSLKPPRDGAGLGLAVCYSIVDRHHGKIQIDSEEDYGTTVRVELPCCASCSEVTTLGDATAPRPVMVSV